MSAAATGPPSVCSKPPYENDCVHLTEAKFRSKATPGRRGMQGGGRGWFGADWELCMKWKFVLCDEQICERMGMLIIIISGEICQFIFAFYTEDINTKLELVTCDVTSSWVKLSCVFFRSPNWHFYCTDSGKD